MNLSNDFDILEDLFFQATQLPSEQRASFAVEKCAGDREIREQLLSLLART